MTVLIQAATKDRGPFKISLSQRDQDRLVPLSAVLRNDPAKGQALPLLFNFHFTVKENYPQTEKSTTKLGEKAQELKVGEKKCKENGHCWRKCTSERVHSERILLCVFDELWEVGEISL